MAKLSYACRIVFQNITINVICHIDTQYCCGNRCCPISRRHNELWETWYFWFGIILICLFVLTSIFSYVASTCKRKSHNIIRIRNVAAAMPVISTISGPGGIIQPRVHYKENYCQPPQDAYIDSSELNIEDFGPLDPPYPPAHPVTIIKGNAPTHGYRQTSTYTELVLPPGYVDTEKRQT